METSSPAVPAEPVITIISSDGETFSLRANTVVHSNLLDGAVRKWAEVYQAPLQSAVSAHRGNRSGSLPDDATTTDITADDPEETPDERFIQGYYDETASDVTAASGMIEDTLNSLNGRMAVEGEGGDSEGERPKVMRMVSVPVNGDDDEDNAEGSNNGIGGHSDNTNDDDGDQTPCYADMPAKATTVERIGADDDDDDATDSDRTASVLPSSHEGSMSSSTTPTKLSSNNGDVPSPSAAPRSISPFLRDISTYSSSASSTAAAPRNAALARGSSLPGRGGAVASSCNGSALGVCTLIEAATGADSDAEGLTKKSVLTKNGLVLRSPASALSSPVSRGSHPFPSTLMDADQSTPSVLSEEEEEVMEADGDDTVEKPAKPRKTTASADPRNLGDEGLDEIPAERQRGRMVGNGEISPTSLSPSPEATAVETAIFTGGNSNKFNASTSHVDPLNPVKTTFAPKVNVVLYSGDVKPPSPLPSSSRSRLNERRHNAILIQAGAANEDIDDAESASTSGGGGGALDSIAPRDLAVPAIIGTNIPGSSRSGGGGNASASPAPDWRSPSSCHQRTPCIADEDDVGAIVDDDDGHDSTHNKNNTNSGSTKLNEETAVANANAAKNTTTAAVATEGNSSDIALTKLPAHDGNTTATAADATRASLVKSTSALSAAADRGSTVIYKDGIRITSSAIVVNLSESSSPRTAATTPMVSPQSLCEAGTGGGSLDMPGNESQDLLSLSSVGGTAAGCGDANLETHAASANSAHSAEALAGTKINIHSRTLMLCIKYMTHFAEAEALAAAAAVPKKGRHKKHLHHNHRSPHNDYDSSNNSSATTPSTTSTPSSSDESSDTGSEEDSRNDGEAESSTGSNTSVNPPGQASVLPVTSNNINNNSNSPTTKTTGGGGIGAERVKAGGPATIPTPLTAPLITRLSPWERSFLYTDVLGAPETVLTAAMAIQEVCPDFDYCCPGPYLSKPRVKAAIMAPPPPPDGVHALVEVMAAAKQLQIDPLRALCAGWLADFMIRVSYGATDNFEAAHLIRQCLRVPSDWNRRETDSLKLENEWPANEDAE